jgi:hypothetical protein
LDGDGYGKKKNDQCGCAGNETQGFLLSNGVTGRAAIQLLSVFFFSGGWKLAYPDQEGNLIGLVEVLFLG